MLFKRLGGGEEDPPQPQCPGSEHMLDGVVNEHRFFGFDSQTFKNHLIRCRIRFDQAFIPGAEDHVEQLAYPPIEEP